MERGEMRVKSVLNAQAKRVGGFHPPFQYIVKNPEKKLKVLYITLQYHELVDILNMIKLDQIRKLLLKLYIYS
jgi:hypothetical protein